VRPLTPKERKLLTALLIVAFLMANLFGLPRLARQQTLLQTQIKNLRAQQDVAQTWFKEKDLWTERKAWLETNQPKLATSSDASATFLAALQQSAKDNKIKIAEQKLLEPDKRPGCQGVSVRLTVNGSFDSLIKWLNTIQQPNLFQPVLKFKLKIDSEPPNMRCELDIARWYASLL
jgi:hypothetical protein